MAPLWSTFRLGPFNGRAPSDRLFDHFWAAVQDADVAVVFHACDDSYRYEMAKVWGWGNERSGTDIPTATSDHLGSRWAITTPSPHSFTGRLFERFPLLRIGSIELGCQWVFELARNLETAGQGDLADAPISSTQACMGRTLRERGYRRSGRCPRCRPGPSSDPITLTPTDWPIRRVS